MALRDRMQGQDPAEKLYREERAYRATKLVEKWARIPELGKGLKNMEESTARNTAILLENQARAMSRMTETQMSQNFFGFTPENMLRLVRLAYPNSIRGKLFTEFAMETARDSIKYIRPVYSNSQTAAFPWGNNTSMADRTFTDPNEFDGSSFGNPGSNDGTGFMADPYRKGMYESTEDRYATELSNGAVTDGAANTGIRIVTFAGGPFGADGANLISGYGGIFLGSEKNVLAIQMREGNWYFGAPVTAGGASWTVSDIVTSGANGQIATVTVLRDGIAPTDVQLSAVGGIKAFGRYDSEGDLVGDYLGEVELVMTDYQFRPRPLTLGVTWTKLTELVLDTSFGVSAEEMLLDAAGQEIKKALDFRAVKYAYASQRQMAADQVVTFNAEAAGAHDDSYFHTAQLVKQPIARIGDLQLNKINRGGVSRLVGGPGAITYLSLYKGFTTKGAQPAIGGHQVGEVDGIPVFKVPSSIIPDNEILTVWKNEQNEADVSVAFGTLLPFFSTGALQRKNMYQEAAVARFEDQHVLQPNYLGRIIVDGIRELQ